VSIDPRIRVYRQRLRACREMLRWQLAFAMRKDEHRMLAEFNAITAVLKTPRRKPIKGKRA
jgi:hypothetical protein